MDGLDLFFDNLDIPIDNESSIEYEIGPFCHLVYLIESKDKYLHYVEEKTGEEYEELIDSLSLPIYINGVQVTKEDIDTFEKIIEDYLTI